MTSELMPIPGLEGYYASEDGTIYSTHKTGLPLPLVTRLNRHGYPSVRVKRGEARPWQSVHKLVALAFLPKPPNACLVRHLDGTRTNNHVSNLAWGTPIDNAADMIRHGRSLRGRKINRSHAGEANPNAKLTHEQILEIRRRWEERVTLASLAREYGVTYVTISSIVQGKLWSRYVRLGEKAVALGRLVGESSTNEGRVSN